MDHPHAFAQCTALHFAAEMGHVDVISALCEAGADADARKSTGGTPLHTAADCDQPRAVASLLAPPCSASPNLLLNGDTTPLYLAAQVTLTLTLTLTLTSSSTAAPRPFTLPPRRALGLG